jgi:aspartyl-tRNA(Asn)/glutamyl-tRNA(Gln) amidotransferase subunit B
MPELPDARRRRFAAAFGLSEYDAAQLTQSRTTAEFFEGMLAAGAPPMAASIWIMGELARALKARGRDLSDPPLAPERLAGLIALIDSGKISGAIAKDVFEKMLETGRSADDIVAAEGLTQIDDEREIAALVARVIGDNADAVAQYRGGRAATFGFLVGQAMKAAGGKANPKRINELLRRALDAGSA